MNLLKVYAKVHMKLVNVTKLRNIFKSTKTLEKQLTRNDRTFFLIW